MAEYAFVSDVNNEDILNSAQLSLVDVLAHMIISCRGSSTIKASMLFDLFGHFEKERDDAAKGDMLHHLYYDIKYDCS